MKYTIKFSKENTILLLILMGKTAKKNQLIILNADTNLKKIDVDYTNKAKEYLRAAYVIDA